jgi:hypothetical protein
MLSEPFLSQQLQLADQQVKTWRQIDPRQNSLLSKKLMRAHRKAALEIKEQTNQIRFVNRLSFNPTGIELRIVNMWGQKINELIETDYAIFCKEWEEIQGNKRTAVFVRAASAQLLRMIKRWGDSAAHGAKVLHPRRTGIDKSTIHGSYTKLVRKLCEDWKERLDIEAGDLHKQETAQRRRGLDSAGDFVPPHPPVRPSLSSSVVPFAVQHQSVNKGKSFVRPTEFETLAGSLYAGELLKAPNKRVSKDALLSIADQLDKSNFVPPKDFLESSHRTEVVAYNRKIGTHKALTTWRKLASNPQHQRGMRRRLGHAAQKVRRHLSAKSLATSF